LNSYFTGVIPKRPLLYQRAEGSPVAQGILAGDPFDWRLRAGSSLHLKNGCAQDDPLKSKPNFYNEGLC
jgi:hypothetical protein